MTNPALSDATLQQMIGRMAMLNGMRAYVDNEIKQCAAQIEKHSPKLEDSFVRYDESNPPKIDDSYKIIMKYEDGFRLEDYAPSFFLIDWKIYNSGIGSKNKRYAYKIITSDKTKLLAQVEDLKKQLSKLQDQVEDLK